MMLDRKSHSLPVVYVCGVLAFPGLFGSWGNAHADEPWVSYASRGAARDAKHIVFVTGDDEYRSEEGMPMLAKILAVRHGFRCTVLLPIDLADGTIKPDYQTNIPGLHQLRRADLMVIFTRFRQLPDEQMKFIVEFIHSGKPIVGLRTATHAFQYQTADSPYAKYAWNSPNPAGGFGQLVLGDTWVSHHGEHGRESTRGVINPELAAHPILRGVQDIWGPTDVYAITHLPQDARVLLHGQVIAGMSPQDPAVEGEKNHPMMPLAWIRHYQGESGKTSRVFTTTMGASVDLENEGLRRLLVNACYWGLEMEDQIPAKSNVDYVGIYQPTPFGHGNFQKGLKPSDLQLAH
jgi:hypothetical protein